MHRKASHITILKVNSATIRPNQTYYKVESSRFTSTIWPQQADNLTFIDMDIDPIHHRPTTIYLDQLIRTKNRLFGSPFRFEDRRLNF
jgi:hypothetical protein